MKNTLKDVIELVLVSPSVCLDMSDENLKQVWAIKHPDKANNELCKKAQVHLQAEAALQQSTDAVVPSHGGVVEVDPVEVDEVKESACYFVGVLCSDCGKKDCNCKDIIED